MNQAMDTSGVRYIYPNEYSQFLFIILDEQKLLSQYAKPLDLVLYTRICQLLSSHTGSGLRVNLVPSGD